MTVTGTTSSGFAWTLDERVVDNMELVDALADASDDDPLAVSRVCRLMLGDEQRKQLYDHLRTEDGRVPFREVSQALIDIMGGFKAGKN